MFSKKEIDELREKVSALMSPKRFFHTAEVEKMAMKLGEIYMPDMISELRVSALLHDITKEKTLDEQLALCEKYGIEVKDTDIISVKTLHSKTASALIGDEFPEFATDFVKKAIFYHTTGHKDMTLSEKIIYLSDYIDMSRQYEECIRLRNAFFDFDFDKSGEEEKLTHLDKVMLMSYDITVSDLLDEHRPIAEETIEARNELIVNMSKNKGEEVWKK